MKVVAETFSEAEVTEHLRTAGVRFAFVYGSRTGLDGPWHPPRHDSDLDVGAWWGEDPPASWEVEVPEGVDLLVLDDGSLDVVGRVALHGRLLYDDDPPARVRWQADTIKVFNFEAPRRRQFDRDYREAVLRGRR